VTTRLVLASNNAKKLSELRVLLAGVAVQLVPQGELGISEADEPHITFIENALAKARHAAQACGGAAIADDSGVCVDALGGQPGVASAHFAPALLPAGADREARRRVQDAANNAPAAAAPARHHRPRRALRQHPGGRASCAGPAAAGGHGSLAGPDPAGAAW
jgi:non-canonical purine NTP pyrophosphatase (RdgB/HAM1 family)